MEPGNVSRHSKAGKSSSHSLSMTSTAVSRRSPAASSMTRASSALARSLSNRSRDDGSPSSGHVDETNNSSHPIPSLTSALFTAAAFALGELSGRQGSSILPVRASAELLNGSPNSPSLGCSRLLPSLLLMDKALPFAFC